MTNSNATIVMLPSYRVVSSKVRVSPIKFVTSVSILFRSDPYDARTEVTVCDFAGDLGTFVKNEYDRINGRKKNDTSANVLDSDAFLYALVTSYQEGYESGLKKGTQVGWDAAKAETAGTEVEKKD